MAEASAAVASIQGVVDFGLQLSTTIHTYVEAVWEAKDRLRDVAIDINSTASTLKQIGALVQADRAQATKVFKDDGLEEVLHLTTSLKKVYSLIVILLTKAGTPEARGKVLAESVDPVNLDTSVLTRHMRWNWLAPRGKRVQVQLRLLKTKLLLNLQLANLARVQLGLPERQPGAFQQELILRSLSLKLRKKELRSFKNLVAKYGVTIEESSSDTSSIYSLDREIIPLDRDTLSKDDRAFIEEIEKEESDKVKEPNAPESGESSPSTDTKTESTAPTSVTGDGKPEVDNSDCVTLVDEPLGVKDIDADLKKPVPEDSVVPPPPPPPAPVVEEPKPEEPKESEKPAAEDADDSKKAEEPKAGEDESINLEASTGTFSILPSWLKNLFGKSDKRFTHDWESPTLECFIISNEFKLFKLPFGHQRLTYGLKRTQRKVGLTWDQYMALDSPHKKEISKAITKAKGLDSRQRTCVAIGTQKKKNEDDFVIIFLTLGPKVEPVKFKDAVGRVFTVPFENTKTWDSMKKVIEEAFLHVDVIGPHVLAGHYDLINSSGAIMLPSIYASLITPGESISMHMWPMSEPHRPFPTHHNGPPPPPPSNNWPGPSPPNNWPAPPPMPPIGRPHPRMGPPGPPPPPGWVGRWPPGPPAPPPHGRPPYPRGSGGPPVIVLKPSPPPPIIRKFTPPKKKTDPVSIYSWLSGKTPYYRRRMAYNSDSESEDGSELNSDSDVENEDKDIELAIDIEREKERAGLCVGELLGRWTNAVDCLGGEDLDSDAESVSSSGSSSSSTSLVDD